jgi:hypothetical protein
MPIKHVRGTKERCFSLRKGEVFPERNGRKKNQTEEKKHERNFNEAVT